METEEYLDLTEYLENLETNAEQLNRLGHIDLLNSKDIIEAFLCPDCGLSVDRPRCLSPFCFEKLNSWLREYKKLSDEDIQVRVVKWLMMHPMC